MLVDDADLEVGFATKQSCHDGDGLLHRAFSVFLFSPKGEVLLQQRSAHKRLWPGAWSTTCCSHPRCGETLDTAVHRRLREELGLAAEVEFLFKFQYHARYDGGGSEHELCHVYAGLLKGAATVNPNEIADTRMMRADVLDGELDAMPELYTPWLKLEWTRLRTDSWPSVQKMLAAS